MCEPLFICSFRQASPIRCHQVPALCWALGIFPRKTPSFTSWGLESIKRDRQEAGDLRVEQQNSILPWVVRFAPAHSDEGYQFELEVCVVWGGGKQNSFLKERQENLPIPGPK